MYSLAARVVMMARLNRFKKNWRLHLSGRNLEFTRVWDNSDDVCNRLKDTPSSCIATSPFCSILCVAAYTITLPLVITA